MSCPRALTPYNCNFLASPLRTTWEKKRADLGLEETKRGARWHQLRKGTPSPVQGGRPSPSLGTRGENRPASSCPLPLSLHLPRPSLAGLVVVEGGEVSGQNEDLLPLYIHIVRSVPGSGVCWGKQERGERRSHYVFAQTAIQSRSDRPAAWGFLLGVGKCDP